MKSIGGFLKKIISLISYKPIEYKEFYIQEYFEEDGVYRQGQPNSEYFEDTPNNTSNNEKANIHDKNTPHKLPNNLEQNLKLIKDKFNFPLNKDVVIHQFTIASSYRAFIVYIDGMINKILVNNYVLKPFLDIAAFNETKANQLNYLIKNVIERNQSKIVTSLDEVVAGILSGDTALYIDGSSFFVISDTKGFEKRGVEKPQVEGIVRGPQEAFNENLRTNITLLRRIIKNNNLTTEILQIGDKNKNNCAIVYMKEIVNESIVKEVKRRLSSIRTDYLDGSGMLEQFIEDRPISLVPTILSTERPDRVASHLVEGRVAILSDGSPFVLVVPITLAALFHTPEDASVRWQYGTLFRLIRVFACIVSILLPGLYIAITTFHHEMIPTELLIAIAKARENVPFPTIVEIILMELSFELIREAGIRIPGIIGNTIGIIGALIIGQAAVQADLVSPVLIIIIAVTGLGNFAIPDYSLGLGIRICRILFITSGALLGFYGISLMLVILASLLLDIKSFGVDFCSPLAPKLRKSYDMFIRYPVWKQEFRPDELNPKETRKQPHISRGWIFKDSKQQSRGDSND